MLEEYVNYLTQLIYEIVIVFHKNIIWEQSGINTKLN